MSPATALSAPHAPQLLTALSVMGASAGAGSVSPASHGAGHKRGAPLLGESCRTLSGFAFPASLSLKRKDIPWGQPDTTRRELRKKQPRAGSNV